MGEPFPYTPVKLLLSGDKYFDFPDDKHCEKRIWRMFKLGTFSSIPFFGYEVILQRVAPVTVSGAITRCLSWYIPITASFMVVPAVTCLAANLRNKNDYLNPALGGAACGAIWAAKYRHFRASGPIAMIIASTLFPVVNTYFKVNNLKVSADTTIIDQMGFKNTYSWKRDWSTGFFQDMPRPKLP